MFQVSPGVEVKEIDLTGIVPGVATAIGAFAGSFGWGPVNDITTVSTEADVAREFGKPTNANFSYFLTLASYLRYSSFARVVRAAQTGQLNATSGGAGILIENRDEYDNDGWVLNADGTVAAKYPGAMGNGLEVEIMPADDTAFGTWTYRRLFDTAPNTSQFVADRGGSNDEMHIVVVDTLGKFSGNPGEILETFAFVSQASDARKEDGSSNYYRDVLKSSRYVYWTDHPTLLTNAGEPASFGDFIGAIVVAPITETLTGGNDGSAVDVGDLTAAYSLFSDSESVDVNLIFSHQLETEVDAVTLGNNLIALAEGRKDAVAFISPPITATVGTLTPAEDVITFFDQLTSSSYAVFDSGAVKVYDKYNDAFRWIVASGHVAGLTALTESTSDAWFSPAGFNRGQLLGITKLSFNPNKTQRDDLYRARVNPIVTFPGEGTVLFGDKTALAKPSAFDRINVRRLFIVLEKAIATAAKFSLFEFNDEFTRAQFRNIVEPFLREVQGRRGVTEFLVVCDERNNTPQVIDSNSFVADIYITPNKSINFITLNFVATRTGVDFSEIVG